MKRIICGLVAIIGLTLTLMVPGAASASIQRSGPIDISSGNCHHEQFTAGIVQGATDSFLQVTWTENGCGWWLWPRTHCEDPKIGVDQGWKEGGHVHTVGLASGTRPKCTDPAYAAINLARYHHSCNCGTTYQVTLAPGIKQHPAKAVTTAFGAIQIGRTSWYHICLTHSKGSHCIAGNGVAKDLSLVAGAGNKWQAIPDGTDGKIMWQNGSGNCMSVDGSNNGVQEANAACTGAPQEDWYINGSGNLTFENGHTGDFMGTNGDKTGKLVYAHPAMTGFYYGWTTFSCCVKG